MEEDTVKEMEEDTVKQMEEDTDPLSLRPAPPKVKRNAPTLAPSRSTYYGFAQHYTDYRGVIRIPYTPLPLKRHRQKRDPKNPRHTHWGVRHGRAKGKVFTLYGDMLEATYDLKDCQGKVNAQGFFTHKEAWQFSKSVPELKKKKKVTEEVKTLLDPFSRLLIGVFVISTTLPLLFYVVIYTEYLLGCSGSFLASSSPVCVFLHNSRQQLNENNHEVWKVVSFCFGAVLQDCMRVFVNHVAIR